MSFGYSGKARVGRAGIWLNGSFGSGVTAHELGHNYGVHHANLWQTTDGSVIGAGANVEYGNVFDVMGRGGIRGHFNAWFKTRLDWLLTGDYTQVTESGTYPIEPIDDPAATGQRALRIVKDTTRNYWVEFRQAFTTNRWAMQRGHVELGLQQQHGQPSPGHDAGLVQQPERRAAPGRPHVLRHRRRHPHHAGGALGHAARHGRRGEVGRLPGQHAARGQPGRQPHHRRRATRR